MDNNIKILRFKDGLDVICKVTEESIISLDIEDPMMFEVRNSNLLIQQWLPIATTKTNKVSIRQSDILFKIEPNENFKEYYEGLVSKINDVVESNDIRNASMDKIKALMEEIESSANGNQVVH
jgi:hypothetical protein